MQRLSLNTDWLISDLLSARMIELTMLPKTMCKVCLRHIFDAKQWKCEFGRRTDTTTVDWSRAQPMVGSIIKSLLECVADICVCDCTGFWVASLYFLSRQHLIAELADKQKNFDFLKDDIGSPKNIWKLYNSFQFTYTHFPQISSSNLLLLNYLRRRDLQTACLRMIQTRLYSVVRVALIC